MGRLAAGLILLGLLWRTLRYALGFPIWGDEAFVAVNFVLRDLRGLIRPLVYGQIAPLGFMWAELGVSRLLGLSEWALRLIPFVAGVAALLLFWRFSAWVLPRRAALLASGIFAASFYLVRHGAEVKPYATDLLISLLLSMLGWRAFLRPTATGWWVGLVVAAGLAVWCSFPAVFVAGSVGLLLAWLTVRQRGRWPLLLGTLSYGLVLCGSFLAMYWVYAKPHAEAAARLKEIPMWTVAFPPLRQPGELLKWLAAIHTGQMLAYPHGGSPPGSIATLLLVVLGSIRLWRTQRPLLLLLLGPLPLTFLAAAIRAYPYGGSARTSLYLAPAFCLLAGLGLFVTLRYLLRGARFRVGLTISAGALAAFMLGGMVADGLRPYQSAASQRSRQAVLAVTRQTRPNDRWVVFNADRPVPYAPYLGEWRGVGGQFVFDVLRFAPVQLSWAPPPESVELPAGGRVWLLVYRAVHKKVSFPEDQLATYLATMRRRLGTFEHQSYGIKDQPGKIESVEVYRFGS